MDQRRAENVGGSGNTSNMRSKLMEWVAAVGILFSPKEWRAAERRVHARRVMAIAEERRRAWLLDAGKCALGVHVNVYLDYPRGHRCSRCGELVPRG